RERGPVSGAPPARAQEVGSLVVEAHRHQSPRAMLRAHGTRPRAAPHGAEAAAHVHRRAANGPRSGLTVAHLGGHPYEPPNGTTPLSIAMAIPRAHPRRCR